MNCLDNKDIKYDSYIHRVAIKFPSSSDKFGYWDTFFESWISPGKIEEEKAEFVRRYEEMDKGSVTLHSKYCMEYDSFHNNDRCTYLEYIMGFVSLNQNE